MATTATSVTTTPAQGMKTSAGTPSAQYTPSKPDIAAATTSAKGNVASQENKAPSGMSSTMAQLAQEAAAAVKEKKVVPAALKPTTATPTPATPTPASASDKAASNKKEQAKEDDEEDVDDDELEAALFGDEDDDEIDEALFGDADEEEEKEVPKPAPLKTKTPLSPTSIPLPATPGLNSPDPTSLKGLKLPTSPHMTHRGSDISVAHDDEIRKVENEEAIPEDDESEGEDDEDSDGETAAASKAKSTEKSETDSLADKVGKVKIQDQAPAEGKLATESVED